MLHPLAHLHHVPQDELGGGRLAATDVACPRCSMLQAAPVGGGSKTVGGVHAARCLPPRQHAIKTVPSKQWLLLAIHMPHRPPTCAQEVQARYDVAGMLHQVVQLSLAAPLDRLVPEKHLHRSGGAAQGGWQQEGGFYKVIPARRVGAAASRAGRADSAGSKATLEKQVALLAAQAAVATLASKLRSSSQACMYSS